MASIEVELSSWCSSFQQKSAELQTGAKLTNSLAPNLKSHAVWDGICLELMVIHHYMKYDIKKKIDCYYMQLLLNSKTFQSLILQKLCPRNAVFSSTVGRKHNLSPVDNNIFMQSCIERVIEWVARFDQ